MVWNLEEDCCFFFKQTNRHSYYQQHHYSWFEVTVVISLQWNSRLGCSGHMWWEYISCRNICKNSLTATSHRLHLDWTDRFWPLKIQHAVLMSPQETEEFCSAHDSRHERFIPSYSSLQLFVSRSESVRYYPALSVHLQMLWMIHRSVTQISSQIKAATDHAFITCGVWWKLQP